jgi:hypothetical protein
VSKRRGLDRETVAEEGDCGGRSGEEGSGDLEDGLNGRCRNVDCLRTEPLGVGVGVALGVVLGLGPGLTLGLIPGLTPGLSSGVARPLGRALRALGVLMGSGRAGSVDRLRECLFGCGDGGQEHDIR